MVIPFLIPMMLFMLSCKPAQNQHTEEQSITLKGQDAGKWIASVSIGGGVSKEHTLYLANVLKETFLSPMGGGYKSAFHIDDKGTLKPKKRTVTDAFAKLKSEIAAYKKQKPSAPTMVVLSLTGHGISKEIFPKLGENYQMVVDEYGYQTKQESSYFSGGEIAQLIAQLNADETLVFVQSCMSGNLAKVNFTSQYAESIANEAKRLKTNIAVVTPVHELVSSPVAGIEPLIKKAFQEISNTSADVGTYAMFKDSLTRLTCESEWYYPRTEFKDTEAVAASLEAGEWELNAGLAPQFFENISANLPLVLSAKGLQKYENKTLTLPPGSNKSNSVPLSQKTINICNARISELKKKFERKESLRVMSQRASLACQKESSFSTCYESKMKEFISANPPQEPQPN